MSTIHSYIVVRSDPLRFNFVTLWAALSIIVITGDNLTTSRFRLPSSLSLRIMNFKCLSKVLFILVVLSCILSLYHLMPSRDVRNRKDHSSIICERFRLTSSYSIFIKLYFNTTITDFVNFRFHE